MRTAGQRFIELLTKELIEELTSAEKQELELLFQQNPSYKKQAASIEEYWNSDAKDYNASAAKFSKMMDVINLAEKSIVDDRAVEQEQPQKNAILWPAVRYIAATLVAGLTLYFWYLSTYPAKNAVQATNWQRKITSPRMKARMVLSDSTIVTLNSGTTLKYPVSFEGKNREVYLNGEAFFEVHKDKKHPFIIHTNEMNVKVLGTAFNIKSYDNESHSETSLIHGSIEVTLNDRVADRIILKPHEKLIIEKDKVTLNLDKANKPAGSNSQTAAKGTQYSLTNLTYSPSIDSAAVETLWLKNKLVFKNEDFESIAADMERWYGIQIIFKREELKKFRFTANFQKESAVEALESLRLTEDFHFKKDGTMFYISK